MNTFEIQRELDRELGPDERLIWTGRPSQGLRFRWFDVFITLFIFVWLAIPLFGATALFRSGKVLFSAAFLLPFLLMGVYILSGRFFVDARLRARTFYGITSQRILVVVTGRTRRTTSLSLKSLPDVTFSENRDGSGSIQFGSNRIPGANWYGPSWPGMSEVLAPRFDLAEHARQVYELVRKAQADLSTRG